MTEITIAFGTETGNSESLAKSTARKLQALGHQAQVIDLEEFTLELLSSCQFLLLITSTYGEGEPPGNSEAFYDDLMESQLSLSQLNFSVCGLGDTSYELFCQCGKDLDRRLAELGAHRFAPRVDCDVEYVEYRDWLDGVIEGLAQRSGASKTPAPPRSAQPAQPRSAPPAQPRSAPPITPKSLMPHSSVNNEDTALSPLVKDRSVGGVMGSSADQPPLGSKARPIFAEIVENRNLNHPESEKETRHICISLKGIELEYQVGDSLGVHPRNNSDLINEMLHYLGLSRDEWVDFEGEHLNLFYVLKYRKDIVKIDSRLLKLVQPNLAPPHIQELANNRRVAKKYMDGHHIIDLLRTGCIRPSADQIIDALRTLSPRLYSISSSPKAHPGYVHLTVDVLRYDLYGSQRHGVASNFLGDSEVGGHVAVYVHPTKDFMLCAPDRPIIMIGPGTGIAPFKAMLEERETTRAPGQSWLFFGAQRSHYDFLYRDLLEGWVQRGVLSQLNCAWSRDQANKIYVQDLMYQHSVGIWRWLEAGAYLYLCGDAKRMAKDVHSTLLRIISEQGNISEDDAEEYMSGLRHEKRYLRDVY
jgi:sulfite reductase (NADPH) flavoprotein alpha-component